MTEMAKVKKMMKLDASVLGKLAEMEHSLAKQEAKGLEDALPDGHPLKAEVEKQKAIMGGDLSGLPAGHPLMRALNTAKETYEIRQAEEKKKQESSTAGAEPSPIEMRKAKRLDESVARRARYEKEDQDNEEVRDASKAINKSLDEVLSAVRDTWQTLSGFEETLNQTPTGRVKLLRLKRILFATERGLSETRIGRV